jgi:hypothetical protein
MHPAAERDRVLSHIRMKLSSRFCTAGSIAVVMPAPVPAAIVMTFDDDAAIAELSVPVAVPAAIVLALDDDGFRFCRRQRRQSEAEHRKPRRNNN